MIYVSGEPIDEEGLDGVKQTYYEKISLHNKTPEEAEVIIKLFEDNINLANRVAQKYYKTKYWEFDEAIQIARMGLWKACLIWNPDKYRLSTLAYNIINRDFIDYDKRQKRQPKILFNMEDNCVTEDISLADVLIDEDADIESIFVDEDNYNELAQEIVEILNDIAEELGMHPSLLKIVYLVYIDSVQDNVLSIKMINFMPKQKVKEIIDRLQNKLLKNLGRDTYGK